MGGKAVKTFVDDYKPSSINIHDVPIENADLIDQKLQAMIQAGITEKSYIVFIDTFKQK